VIRLDALVPLALTLALAACGPAAPANAPEPGKDSEPAGTAGSAGDAKSEAPEAAKPETAKEDSPAEALARDLLKAGGRRIAWSASKKRFIIPTDARAEGGRGLDLRFYDDEGNQRDIQRVCQPGECEERLDEIVKQMIPTLAARLDHEGFEAISSVGWPSGRDEIEVGTLNAKLKNDRGRLSIVREKKTTALKAASGHAPKGDVSVVYPVPSAKLLGVVAGDFFVFKLP
jgi:hypothetical protein